MHTLNCISLTDQPLLKTYIDRFTQLGYCVKVSNSFQSMEEAKTIDGILIFEENLNNIGEICKYMIDLRRESNALIWVLIPEQIHSAKLIYLQVGADAVFTYESELEVNILTMTNGLKRYNMFRHVQKSEQPTKDNRSLKLNSTNLSAVIDDSMEVPLTRIEYKIMELLLKNPNVAISYQDIYKKIWDDECEQSKFRVSNVIFHLRKKLDEDSIEPRFIKTIRSKGYLINI